MDHDKKISIVGFIISLLALIVLCLNILPQVLEYHFFFIIVPIAGVLALFGLVFSIVGKPKNKFPTLNKLGIIIPVVIFLIIMALLFI